jgi:hypothetical protein
MNTKLAVPVASAATALLLLTACSDDGDPVTAPSESSTTTSEPAVGALLAEAQDVQLAGEVTTGIRNQTFDIHAYMQAGQATGEFRFDDNVIMVECADSDLGGRVVLGGTATAGSYVQKGDLYALVIIEGEPDRVALVPNEYFYVIPGRDWGGYLEASCDQLLERIPREDPPARQVVEVEDGHDIETG